MNKNFFIPIISYIFAPVITTTTKTTPMTTLTSVKIELSDIVFSMTGFNYGITTEDNNDGTENITFDSKVDAEKFKEILKTL